MTASFQRLQAALGVSDVSASIAFYALIGFEDAVNVAEETKDSTRTFPRTLFMGLGLAGAVYLLVTIVAGMTVPADKLAGSDGPLLEVVQVGLQTVAGQGVLVVDRPGWARASHATCSVTVCCSGAAGAAASAPASSPDATSAAGACAPVPPAGASGRGPSSAGASGASAPTQLPALTFVPVTRTRMRLSESSVVTR